MPTLSPSDSVNYLAHGATLAAYVNPSRGSTELCAWRLTIPADVVGVPHRPSQEEVLLVLEGSLRVTLGDQTSDLRPGSVAHVPAGALLRIDTGSRGGSAWVTTTRGLTATLSDGSVNTPPWAQ